MIDKKLVPGDSDIKIASPQFTEIKTADDILQKIKDKRKKDKQLKILIPMIRRVIPSVIASELIGIQPMSEPVGTIYTTPLALFTYQEPKENPVHTESALDEWLK